MKKADRIADVLRKSERFETNIFFEMSKKLYSDSETRCDSLYDIAFRK